MILFFCRLWSCLLQLKMLLFDFYFCADHWGDTLEHKFGRGLMSRTSPTSTWLPIIGTTLSNINLAADYWNHTLEYQLARRSFGRHSGTSIWQPIIFTTLSYINLAADHRDDTLEHQLDRRSLGFNFKLNYFIENLCCFFLTFFS